MRSSYAKNAIVLGLLSAIGPFAIDMYLPALPTIAADLAASTSATQMTLMVFFTAMGISQIVYGPVSDATGRKPPLYFGLALFILGSIGCGLSSNIDALIGFRLVQGIGAAAGMVIVRAIIRDLHTGIEATRLMSLAILVLSVSPVLAPLTGSALIVLFGWRAVFALITLLGIIGVGLVVLCLPETRPSTQDNKMNVASLISGFYYLIRHRRFLGLTCIGGFGMAGFFVFIASSPFIYINHFGLTPTQYSITFALNAIGFIGGSQFSAKLGVRFGMARATVVAVCCYALTMTILLALTLSGVDNLVMLVGLLFIACACLGPVIPATMVLALDEHGPIAGLASALGGTLQMVLGGFMIVIVSVFFDGTTLPMIATMTLCALCALALSFATLRRNALPLAAEPG